MKKKKFPGFWGQQRREKFYIFIINENALSSDLKRLSHTCVVFGKKIPEFFFLRKIPGKIVTQRRNQFSPTGENHEGI
jgi:hypothetical protein